MADSAIIDRLTQQILAQGTTSKWSGEGKGSAEANARDMAQMLANVGISDIRQFADLSRLQEVQPFYKLNGDFVTEQDGKYFKTVTYQGEGDYSTLVPLTKDEIAQLKPVYGERYVDASGDYAQTLFRPYSDSDIVQKDGKSYLVTNRLYGNKDTGQTFGGFSSDQSGYAWGGTYDGRGNTAYRAQFAPDGTPYFYTTGGSSSIWGEVAPLIAAGALAVGVPPAAVGAVMGAGNAYNNDGNILEGAIKGGVTGYVGGELASAFAPTGVDPSAASAAADADMAAGLLPEFGSQAAYNAAIGIAPTSSSLLTDNIDIGGGWNPAGIVPAETPIVAPAPTNTPDNIDMGGGWNPATGMGDPVTAAAAAGTPIASPSLDALAADNIDVGGGWNPATGTGDPITAAAAAETGVTSSAGIPKGATSPLSLSQAINGLRAVNSIGSLLGSNAPQGGGMQPGASRRSPTGVDYSQILGLLSNKPTRLNLSSLLG